MHLTETLHLRRQHNLSCTRNASFVHEFAKTHPAWTEPQGAKDIASFFRSIPHTHFSPQTMIFMRLPVPHFGTTSPINDNPCLSPCRWQLLAVPSMSLCPMTIVHRIAQDGILAISTRSLHQPMIARPEALAVASPGQAQLRILNLALIPIVGIHPRIDHMKLDKHTRRLLLSPSVRIAHSKLFLFISYFSRCYNLNPRPCIYTQTRQTKLTD
jgi:hypothetical protein